MSAVRVGNAWLNIAQILVKISGAWVPHTAIYAKLAGEWHLIDLNAEPLDPAYHIWKAYADDESGGGISLNPIGKIYLGLSTGKQTPIVDTSDPAQFTWSLIKGDDGAAAILVSISSNTGGNTFKNNSGADKTLTASVYDMLDGSKLTVGITYQWKKNATVVGTNSSTLVVSASDITDGGSEQYTCEVSVT